MCWQLRTHPNIVGIKASFNGDPNYFYLVQELMTGGELFDSIVKQKHYTEHKARNIAAQLMDAIAYMHRAGIIHRDLKPENVLLTDASENARVKIADFGLSCSVNTVSSIHMLSACGTAAYVLLWCAALRCGVCLLAVRLLTSTIVWSRACAHAGTRLQRCWIETGTPARETSGPWVSSSTSCCPATRRSSAPTNTSCTA